MTLRSIILSTAMPLIAKDPSLRSQDVRVYVHLTFSPLQPITEHAQALKLSREAFRRAAMRLVDTGWAYTHIGPGRSRGMVVVPWMPDPVEEEVVAHLARMRNDIFPYGEWLMKCWLDLCIKDDDFQDNARPEWLMTPSGKRLELDRWYRGANIAFEFQGRQHFKTGEHFVTTGAQLSERMQHDALKARLCTIHGIELIELTAQDLDYHVLREKLAARLPLVPLREKGALFRELAGMSRTYVKHALEQ